jgi:hypothetical protein
MGIKLVNICRAFRRESALHCAVQVSAVIVTCVSEDWHGTWHIVGTHMFSELLDSYEWL